MLVLACTNKRPYLWPYFVSRPFQTILFTAILLLLFSNIFSTTPAKTWESLSGVLQFPFLERTWRLRTAGSANGPASECCLARRRHIYFQSDRDRRMFVVPDLSFTRRYIEYSYFKQVYCQWMRKLFFKASIDLERHCLL